MNSSKDGKPAIYQIKNKINNKIYVGSCTGHYRRKAQHWYKLRNNVHDNIHLQSSWNKYKETSFKFEVLEFVEDITSLVEKEQIWIDKLNACNNKIGYNIRIKANSNLGLIVSVESRKKMSKAKKGVKQNPKYAKSRGLSCRKPIYQYSKDHKLINEFPGVIDAAESLGINRVNISKALSSNYKNNRTAGGFVWKYKEKVYAK